MFVARPFFIYHICASHSRLLV